MDSMSCEVSQDEAGLPGSALGLDPLALAGHVGPHKAPQRHRGPGRVVLGEAHRAAVLKGDFT